MSERDRTALLDRLRTRAPEGITVVLDGTLGLYAMLYLLACRKNGHLLLRFPTTDVHVIELREISDDSILRFLVEAVESELLSIELVRSASSP